jgi:hypothetical protein
MKECLRVIACFVMLVFCTNAAMAACAVCPNDCQSSAEMVLEQGDSCQDNSSDQGHFDNDCHCCHSCNHILPSSFGSAMQVYESVAQIGWSEQDFLISDFIYFIKRPPRI